MLSRQFRALLTFSLIWALSWALLGTAVGLFTWHPRIDPMQAHVTWSLWLVFHAVLYGALGTICGLVSGLMFARVAKGNEVHAISDWRAFTMGAVGGLTPLSAFLGLAVVFGFSGPLLPLLAAGLACSALSGGLATGALRIARRAPTYGHAEIGTRSTI